MSTNPPTNDQSSDTEGADAMTTNVIDFPAARTAAAPTYYDPADLRIVRDVVTSRQASGLLSDDAAAVVLQLVRDHTAPGVEL